MSSDLLQQAMIDAAALKEAAMKNAENALIEKYSAEFNQTVQKLLEQEDPAAAAPPADASAMPPVDPTAAPDMSAAAADPMAGGMDMAGAESDKAFNKVPGAFSGGADDEMITINFDQIKATLNEMMGVAEMHDGELKQDVADDALAAGKSQPDVVVKVKGSKNDVTEKEEMVAVGSGDSENEMEEWELQEDGMEGSDEQELEEGVGGALSLAAALFLSSTNPDSQAINKLQKPANITSVTPAQKEQVKKAIESNVLLKKLNDSIKEILNSVSTPEQQKQQQITTVVNKNLKPIQDTVQSVLGTAASGTDVQTAVKGALEEIELEEETDPASAGADDMKRAADLKKQAADAESRANTAKAKAASEKEKADADAANAAKAASAKSAATAGTSIPSVTENIELTEEELQELAEELRVDLKVGNLSDGYMGSTETQKREQRNVELAAARDEKAAAEREEELKKLGDLVKENRELKKLNNDALGAVATLKEQVEKLNVLNAKLLYTNKALGNISLNERQKNNIVESISKADSVLAAKTIYETVQNAVENKQEREAPQSLRETLNRAATPYVVKKNVNNSVNDLMASRMKALAGIK